MTNEVTRPTNPMEELFSNEVFGDMLIVQKPDDSLWFRASDVAKALGIKNSREMITRLPERTKGVISTDTLGGEQEVTCLSEEGLYEVVFTSRKKVARDFRSWVFGTVLPAIRKRGMYAVSAELEASNNRVRELEVKLQIPPGQLYTATELAAILNLGSAQKLNRILEDRQILRKIGKKWMLNEQLQTMNYVYANNGKTKDGYCFSQILFTEKFKRIFGNSLVKYPVLPSGAV